MLFGYTFYVSALVQVAAPIFLQKKIIAMHLKFILKTQNKT